MPEIIPVLRSLKVFVCSPSDCFNERERVRKVISNKVNSFYKENSLILVPDAWDWGGLIGVGRPQEIINQSLDVADIGIFIFWHRIGSDAGLGVPGTVEELNRMLERRSKTGTPEIMLFFKESKLPLKDFDPDQYREVKRLKEIIEKGKSLFCRTFSSGEKFEEILIKSLAEKMSDYINDRQLKPVLPNLQRQNTNEFCPSDGTPPVQWKKKMENVSGFDTIKTVFTEKDLKGRVFAVELLTQPLTLSKKDGKKVIKIDRRNVTHAIYTNTAKTLLCKSCFEDLKPKEKAKELDHQIHNFFLGNSLNSKIEIPLENLPLRWASGGVFPVVRYKKEDWTLFFFRDIPPFGWNIPLGSSENHDHLNDPWSFLWREFLEEFLVICQKPKYTFDKNGNLVPLEYKQMRIGNINNLFYAHATAEQFSRKHIKIRKECDQLFLVDSQQEVNLNINNTKNTLSILMENGSNQWENVLVAINPLELGIEVVAVVTFNLEENDYVLDGEILEPLGGTQEIVRMPVALISHRYLQKAFGSGQLNYYGEIQPSVKSEPISQDEFVLFDWDIFRRIYIAVNPKLGKGTEARRYKKTILDPNFGDFFQNKDELYIPSFFTPTSAKIVSYYFASKN